MAKHNGTTPLLDNPLTRLVRDSASQAWSAGRGAKSRVYEARSSASEAWDRLESAFVHRVARALNALQIPTARDVHELNARVGALQKAVVALERRAAETAAAPQHAPRRKPAVRPKSAARSAGKVRRTARRKSGG